MIPGLEDDPDWFPGIGFVAARDPIHSGTLVWFICPKHPDQAFTLALRSAFAEYPDLVCGTIRGDLHLWVTHKPLNDGYFQSDDWLPINTLRLARLRQATKFS